MKRPVGDVTTAGPKGEAEMVLASPATPATPVESTPRCFWCDSNAPAQAFRNMWDFDPLRDAETPTLWL